MDELTIMKKIRELWEGDLKNKKVAIIKIIQSEFELSLIEAKEIVDKYVSNKDFYDNKLLYDITKPKREKSEIIQEMNVEFEETSSNLLNNYKSMRDSINKLLIAQDLLEQLIKELNEAQKKEKSFKDKMGIFSYLFAFLGFFIFIYSCTKSSWIIVIMGIINMFILIALGGTIDIIRDVESKFASEAKNIHQNQVVPLMQEIESQKKCIEDIWNSKEMYLFEQTVPEEYSNLDALNFFIHALEIGRATSRKELINLYEEELHRRRLEEAQNQILDTQKKQLDIANKNSETLKQLNKNQRKISRQVRYGNAVSTIDFLLKK